MKMELIRKALLVLLVMLFTWLIPQAVCADAGPKPSMTFKFVYETTQPVTLVGGEQMQCDDAACSRSRALGQAGPQRLSCQQEGCRSNAYGYAPYQKLVLQFSDKTRESNVFETGAFNGTYTVRVTDEGLIVQEVSPTFSASRLISFGIALAVTLVLELVVALLFAVFTKTSKRILLAVLVANLFSLPLVWFVFPLLKIALLAVVLSEVFAIVFETVVLRGISHKHISWGKALVLGILMNVVSFLPGLFIYALGTVM
jgi:hypothetical protein